MNVFFDLDGTLWDSSERLYALFCDLVPNNHLTKDEYWTQKRAKVSNEQILSNLGYSLDQISVFVTEWMQRIENEEYLIKDVLFPFTVGVLQTIKNQGYTIYYLTHRQSVKNALWEIREKGIAEFCSGCLISEAKKTKKQLVIDAGIELSQEDVLVGDTGIDIMTARDLGIKSVAVLCGFRDKETLEAYNPDLIINDIRELFV